MIILIFPGPTEFPEIGSIAQQHDNHAGNNFALIFGHEEFDVVYRRNAPEGGLLMLELNDVEEKNARCDCCAGELSLVESEVYGNRCVFCCQEVKKVGYFAFLLRCFYDRKLYGVITRLIAQKGPEEAKMLVLGCISEVGAINMAGIRTIKLKKELIKAIGRIRK